MSSTPPPPTSGDMIDSSCSYFTGSKQPEDYIINLGLAPEDQPVDVQAYLECVGTMLFHDTNDEPDILLPYEPRLDVIAEGTKALREAFNEAPGIWLSASDITPDDMRDFRRNPWIGVLLRTNISSMPGLQKHYKSSYGFKSVIFGNIRIALPAGLHGPDKDSGWLIATYWLYGLLHPALEAAKQLGDVGDKTLCSLATEAGITNDGRPLRPLYPDEQEMFVNDPLTYSQYRLRCWLNKELMPAPPVGYKEWCDAQDKEPGAEPGFRP